MSVNDIHWRCRGGNPGSRLTAERSGMTPPESTLPSCICGNPDCPIPFGCCHCGCGLRTSISKANCALYKWVKDKPKRFAPRHGSRLPYPPYVKEDRGYITPCWIWKRQINIDGYGVGTDLTTSKSKLAHILAYELSGREIPDGYEVDHLCRIRPCVNPGHLEAVTSAINAQRKPSTKMTAGLVISLRRQRQRGILLRVLADSYNISKSQVSDIANGKSWRNI